jgi:AP2 domain
MHLDEEAAKPLQEQYTPKPNNHTLARLGKLRGPYKMKRAFVEQPLDPFIRHISLTQGLYAVVDTHLYDWLMGWNWYARYDRSIGGYYAVRNSETVNRKKSIVSMHAQIMGEDKAEGRLRDHANRMTLDNRGSNLRWAFPNESSSNQDRPRKTAVRQSRFRGVKSHRDGNRWVAQISHMNIKISLGDHFEEKSAARAYDAAASKLHGKFAVLNFPPSEVSLD